jgi:putative phosphoribosyl transferase
LHGETDDVICLEDYEPFGAIGAYYADFGQVSDGEVIDILERFPLRKAAKTEPSTA